MSDFKGREDDDEEDEGGDLCMLRALFGNLDRSGALDLDEDFLDEDAREHLSALSVSCKDSLINIEKSDAPPDFSSEQEDYGRKADNALDFEDEQEVLEEATHAQHEEAILQEESYYARAALAGPLSRPEEDENYDEDDDNDEEGIKADFLAKGDLHEGRTDRPQEGNLQGFDQGLNVLCETGAFVSADAPADPIGSAGHETLSPGVECEENRACMPTKIPDGFQASAKLELPVLYEEDGSAVLWFSELFGQHEFSLLCRRDIKQQKAWRPLRDRHTFNQFQCLEEDDFLFLASGCARKVSRHDVSADYDERKAAVIGKSSPLEDDWHEKHAESQQSNKEDFSDWYCLKKGVDIPSINLQSIHQVDWETSIKWDDIFSSRVRDIPVGTAVDNSGCIDEMDLDVRDDPMDMDVRDDTELSLRFEPPQDSVEETLSSNREWHTSRPIRLKPHEPSFEQSFVRHPQLLRISMLPSLKEYCDGQKVSETLQRLIFQNSELITGNWQEHILWDDDNALRKKLIPSNVIFDLQDDRMMFEVSEGKSGSRLKSHAASMILTSQIRSGMVEFGDTHHTGLFSLSRFNISNDKFYMNKKTTQEQKSSRKKRSVHGVKVLHSVPATKLQTMKPKLANKDLANFHRPKAVWYPHQNEAAAKEQGQLSVTGPMKVILKTMGGKGSRQIVDASESLESVKSKLSKKFRDLRTSEKTKMFYFGRELEFSKSLGEQEVKPNSVLYLVRTKIHPWPKAQRLPGENKPTRPPGAFKKKSDLSVKDGHVFVVEYCEERPLLINNGGMGARLCTYYRKVSPVDSVAATLRTEKESSVGMVIPLEPMEESPFLGDIRPGETQTCLETNMFRSPAFRHKVPPTDFLLVRSAKGKLSLRRIDCSYLIGQQEPHMEVLTPGSKMVQNYSHNRLLTYMYRGFRSNVKPGSVPRLRAEEVSLQFPLLSESLMRKHLRPCADLQRAPGGELWWIMKEKFVIPSEEGLRRMLSPETVCTYESMQAGSYHLKRMGISKLTSLSGLSAAMIQLPDEALVLAAASHLERELQLTPWNLSSNFVVATMQGRGSLERLEITGAGDPSGRGLGFSYLRAAPKPPSATALVEKKAAAARGGGAVTGTDADLRRLSMDAAREVLLKFNVPESQIEKLTRWHRIALVRKLSSEQAASGVKLGASALNKFARGQRMSFLQVQQQTREKCQEIWERQVQSLSAAPEENSQSEGEANEDLDSFAGDLENLLEAEEGDANEAVSAKGKKDGIRGPGARRRAMEAQREEDIEDEEAEAAELRRMLMEDDDTEDVKKKKKTSPVEKTPEEALQEEKKSAAEVKKSSARKKKIIKRIIRTKKPDGTYTSKEILITDPKEVAQYLARKNAGEIGTQPKEKKAPLLSKKMKQPGSTKEGQKPKKTMKSEGGRDGVQLVCGACKQVGHMRTNKKVCPMYTEEAKASIPKVESTEPIEPPVRQGIKITLKGAGTTVQEKDLPLCPLAVPAPLKIPSLKIKLPAVGVVDAAIGSASKIMENSILPIESLSNSDAPRMTEDVTKFIKKIRVQKRLSLPRDDNRKKDASDRSMQLEKLETSKSMFMRLQSPSMVVETVIDRRDIRQEVETFPAFESEQERFQQSIAEARRWQEKRRVKEEKQAREKAERRRRRREEEEEEKRLMAERQKEDLEHAIAQRWMLKRWQDEEGQEFSRREERRRDKKRETELRQHRIQSQQEYKRYQHVTRELPMQTDREQQHQIARAQSEGKMMNFRKQNLALQITRSPARDRRVSVYERGAGTKKRVIENDDEEDTCEISQQPKRRKGGEVSLANILEGIVDKLRKAREISFLFLKPVTKKDAPDYLDIVKHPMDLSTIREKARNLGYKSRAQFRRDVFQIAENAHIYNDIRNPQIPPLADNLLLRCDQLLREKARELTEAELTIEPIGEDSTHATAFRGTIRKIPRQF